MVRDGAARLLTMRAESINQPLVQRRQKLVVENIRRVRPLLELEIFRDLLDRAFEARRIDAADAVVLDVAGQDVVAQEGAQAFEFLFAGAAVHAADDLSGGLAGSLITRFSPPITA